MKLCTGCDMKLPFSYFYRRTKSTDGLSAQCKACRKAYAAKYREHNRRKLRKYNREWHARNPSAKHRYYMSHREKQKKTAKSYRERLGDRWIDQRRKTCKRYVETHRNAVNLLAKNRARKISAELTDSFVRMRLVGKSKVLRHRDIPAALVHAKRIQMQINRFIGARK